MRIWSRPLFLLVSGGLLASAILAISAWSAPGTVIVLQGGTPPPTAPSPTPDPDSWIIIDLPEGASQLEYGAEVYRLVCKACHGDKGQGLTDDWRAQWAPKDQNCWQSKCHALNHPPDGFYMPMSPAVVGPPLVIFNTALDLFEYIHNFMPWHDRGSMTESESWSVTAYILSINGISPGIALNRESAALIDLRGGSETDGPAAGPPATDEGAVPASRVPVYWTAAIVAVLIMAVLGMLFVARRSRR